MPTKGKKPQKNRNKPIEWRKIFTPQIKIAAILASICLVMIVACIASPGTKKVSVVSPLQEIAPMEKVTLGDKITQKFTPDSDYDGLGLYYANYTNYVQSGELHVDVESSGERNQFAYNIGMLTDNSFFYINQTLKKDKPYTITLYLTGNVEGVTFFTTTEAGPYNVKLSRNGKAVETSALVMAFVTECKDYFATWYFMIILALIACYVALNIKEEVYVQKA